MKLVLDFFPILLFFVAYKFAGIYVATAVAIAGTLAQLVYAKLVLKRVDTMLWASSAIVVVFGGLTLMLHNPIFMKWKPTVLYWSLGLALTIASLGFGRNLIRKAMEAQLQLPEPVWGRLNFAWIVFFFAMGAANLAVAFNFPEATWVNFKLFGLMGMMFVFVLAQGLLLVRYAKDDSSS